MTPKNVQGPHFKNEGLAEESNRIRFRFSLIKAASVNNNNTEGFENCVNDTHGNKYWFLRMSCNDCTGHWRI